MMKPGARMLSRAFAIHPMSCDKTLSGPLMPVASEGPVLLISPPGIDSSESLQQYFSRLIPLEIPF